MRLSSTTSSTPWYARAPLIAVLFLLLVGGGVAVWLLLSGTTSGSSDQTTVEYLTGTGTRVTQGTVDSPMRVSLKVPWSNGSPDTAIASVGFEMLDSAGNPALFGSKPGEPEGMKPALEIGVWVFDGSVPSKPGNYHTRVTIQKLSGGPAQTLELRSPELTAVAPEGAGLQSGFVFARNANLWLLSSDTKREKRLTFYPSFYEYADNPAWSPDGKTVAFAYSPKADQDQLPTTDLWTLAASGNEARALVTHKGSESLLDPAWSADGKQVYFSVQNSATDTTTNGAANAPLETWSIDKVDVASGQRSSVATNAEMPDVLPGGGLVYVELVPDTSPDAVSPNKQRLVKADGSGGNSKVLVDESKYQALYGPAVSPDGKWVVFAAIAPPTPQPGGFDFLKLLGLAPEPAFAHGLPWELYMVPIAGGDPIQLTQMNEDQPHAAWLDNSTLAFMGTTGLYKLSIDAAGKPAGAPAKVHEGAPHGGLTWHAP